MTEQNDPQRGSPEAIARAREEVCTILGQDPRYAYFLAALLKSLDRQLAKALLAEASAQAQVCNKKPQ
jgi:hypothetical protein